MNDLRSLFTKYLNDDCTVIEIKALMQHFSDLKQESELKKAIAEAIFEDENLPEENGLDDKMQRIYQQLKPALAEAHNIKPIVKSISGYFKYAIAAAVLLLVSIAVYFYTGQNLNPNNLTAQHHENDVYPGGNKATLTLADGSKISLTDAADGELAKQTGVLITKIKDGQLIYQITKGQSNSAKISYNTISTPAGGQYQINLPDGTTVWLNALSSLKYPTAFSSQERKVTLTGEAYFEVRKDPKKPFLVTTNSNGREQQVNVLGTHFNINSYEDEPAIKTTLLEGSVQVSTSGDSQLLKPGQQSALTQKIHVYDVDVNQVIDWKNGNFYLNDENIQSIMRKLSRWYDIKVVYQGTIPNIGFGGEISRTKELSEVLQALESTKNIHFKIQGRRVTVMQ